MEAADVGRIEVRTIAVGRTVRPGNERLFVEYGRFRGWMYVVNEITTTASLATDGTDFDHYDDHAIHMAAVETAWDEGRIVDRVIGATRLIVDLGDAHHPYARAGLQPDLGRLPVEHHFPEMAAAIDLRQGRVRVEVSRYAATHRRPALQRRTTLALRECVATHYANLGGEAAYAVLEDPLAARLARDGVSLRPMTEPKLLPEYGSFNYGVSIDLDRLVADLDCAVSGRSPLDIMIGVHDAIDR
jgi:hypothetical protein